MNNQITSLRSAHDIRCAKRFQSPLKIQLQDKLILASVPLKLNETDMSRTRMMRILFSIF